MADEQTQDAQGTPNADGVKDTSSAQAAAPEGTKTPEKPVVPEKYELKPSKDSKLDQAHVDGIAEYAKANQMTNEQAQKLLARDEQLMAAQVAKQEAEMKEVPNKWLELAKSDKEFGGDKFAESAEVSKRAMEKWGTPEFMQIMNETGLGNHPELIRVFVRLGKAMAEDKLVKPGAQVGGAKSPEDIFYGKQQ